MCKVSAVCVARDAAEDHEGDAKIKVDKKKTSLKPRESM